MDITITPARLGVALGVTPAELPERLEDVLASLGLPVAIPCDAATYTAAVGRDKKGTGADVTVILLDKIGHAVPRKMPKARLVRLLNSFDKVP